MKDVFSDKECGDFHESYLRLRIETELENKKLRRGRHKNPRYPEDVSESLATRSVANGELLQGFGKLIEIYRSGHPDIVAVYENDRGEHINLLIAVKGTVEDFISYTKDDKKCDILIWLNLSQMVKHNHKIIPVTEFHKPFNYVPDNKDRITYQEMLSLYKNSTDVKFIDSISFPGYTDIISTKSFEESTVGRLWGDWITLE